MKYNIEDDILKLIYVTLGGDPIAYVSRALFERKHR